MYGETPVPKETRERLGHKAYGASPARRDLRGTADQLGRRVIPDRWGLPVQRVRKGILENGGLSENRVPLENKVPKVRWGLRDLRVNAAVKAHRVSRVYKGQLDPLGQRESLDR